MNFYIYELIDPRDDSVFYVGKGQKGRIDQHEVEARKGRQSRKCERIRSIEAAGYRIGKRKVAHFKDELEAYAAEVDLIAFHGLSKLTNIASGGGRGSTGPTIYEDRRLAAQTSAMIVRCRNVSYIEIAGNRLYPNKHFDEVIRKIIGRRSLKWVNAVAAKYRVTYEFADAALN